MCLTGGTQALVVPSLEAMKMLRHFMVSGSDEEGESTLAAVQKTFCCGPL